MIMERIPRAADWQNGSLAILVLFMGRLTRAARGVATTYSFFSGDSEKTPYLTLSDRC
jgi:hypothetical protein